MSDYTELKRLAEAAPNGPWVAENDSLYFKDDGYTRHLMDADAGHDVKDDAYYAALNFIAAANPDVVMSLIATIDVLRSDIESRCEWINEASAEIDRLQNIEVERDQLKAENEALRKDAERYRFLRRGDDRNEVTCMVVMLNRRTGMHVYVQDAYADTQTDAAMAKGEQS